MKLFKRFASADFDKPTFSPETHDAVIRSSICTGEKVAGFKSKKDGHFSEIMLIRSERTWRNSSASTASRPSKPNTKNNLPHSWRCGENFFKKFEFVLFFGRVLL